MPPIDDLDLMLDDPAAAMPMARDFLALEEPEELAPEMELQEDEDDPRKLYERLIANIQSTNIADDMDDDELSAIGQKVLREYEIDLSSRSEWEEKSRKAMDLAMQIAKTKTHPWPGACYSLDTDILTEGGWKPIADVVVGESVYSRKRDGTAGYYPVTRTFRHHAQHLVHFKGKSIDLMVTPNHKMLIEADYPVSKRIANHGARGGKYRRRQTGTAFIGDSQFIYAGDILARERNFQNHYIPLTSTWEGETPKNVYGIDPSAYVRLIGWFVSEGSSIYGRNVHTLKTGEVKDYGLAGSSFSIAQSKAANPDKYEAIRKDIEACGFTYTAYDHCFIVHARSMPDMMKSELRSLGRSWQKHIPRHILSYSSSLLEQMLETMVAGDGHIRRRAGRPDVLSYYTCSQLLADQMQEVAQKVGLRAYVTAREAVAGGVINGRQISGARTGFCISIAKKQRIKLQTLGASLVVHEDEVACVEVEPHHTVYVRRNGKAVWCGNSNVIFPLMTTAAVQFAARAYPAIVQGRNVVKGVVTGKDEGTPMPPEIMQQLLMMQGGGGLPMLPQSPMGGQQPPMMGQQMPGQMMQGGMGHNGGPPMPPEQGAQQQQAWIVPPGAKRERATRIGEHMSWQLLEEMTEWEEQTDKLLHILPIIGCTFRKSYYDPGTSRNSSELVLAENLVIDYHAKSMERAPRLTERIQFYPYEIEEQVRAGLWIEHEYGIAQNANGDDDAPHEFLEQHRGLDLDEDGYPEPYIVTVHKQTGKVARIVARYDAEGVKLDPQSGQVTQIDPVHYYTKYDFMPNPDGGIYGVGFGQLLSPINEAVNTTLNQLFDAGSLQNTGGGFIARGVSMHAGSLKFKIGEWKQINVPGSTLKDAIVPFNHSGPSPQLISLLTFLIDAGREIASVKDVLSGETAAATMQPTTLMALIEQGLKVFTAIFKRVHRSLKKELDKLYRLNRVYLQNQAQYQIGDEWRTVSRDDYMRGAGVTPVSDPTMVSDMQRMAQAQFLQAYQNDPNCKRVEIIKRIFNAAQVEKPEELIIEEMPPNPEILTKTAELEARNREIDIKEASAKTGQMKDMSQVVLNLAQADKVNGDMDLAWTAQYVDVIRAQMELLHQPANGRGQPQGAPQQPPGLPPIPSGPALPEYQFAQPMLQ